MKLSEKELLLEKYWNGNCNKLIRYWFYIQRGLDIFNGFKYLIAAIFGIYWTLKLTEPAWLVVFLSISILVLSFIGYIAVHFMNKVMDYLNIEFGTYWSRYNFELMERQLKKLEEISDGIKVIQVPSTPSQSPLQPSLP
jgi:hypothetical protein